MDAKFVSNIDIFLDALKMQLAKGLEECGLLAEGFAKKECPVDTGALKTELSRKEIADIIKTVKKLYSEYPWR